MMHTDQDFIKRAQDSCSELRDGLFTVVAQTKLIEMCSAHNYDDDKTLYIVETSELNRDKYDHVCNSSYTDTIDVSVYDAFNKNRVTVAFDCIFEAQSYYFNFISNNNHL